MVEILLKDYTDEWGYEYVIGMGLLSGSAISQQIEAAQGQPVNLRINSVGGSCYAGVQIVNAIKKHGDVTAIIDGVCFSCAAFIAAACKEVQASTYTIMMIHNSRICADMWGQFTSNDLQQLANETSNQLEAFDDLQVKIFVEKTKLPEDQIIEMLDEETWMTGQEAKDLGFVDVLTDAAADPIEALLYNQAFARAPMRMVAIAGKTLKTKENKMSTVIEELKAQHEENKGFFSEIKALLGIKPRAQAETTETTEETTAEATTTEETTVTEPTAEQLKAENDQLKKDLKAEQDKSLLAEASLKEAKTMMAETKTLLAEVKSNYKPSTEKPEFASTARSQADPEARFVKPSKK